MKYDKNNGPKNEHENEFKMKMRPILMKMTMKGLNFHPFHPIFWKNDQKRGLF